MTRDLTLLIVDDDPELRAYLRRILEKKHARVAEVLEAADGEGAWTLLQAQAVDAVITDVNLPRLDGLGLCQRLSESHTLPPTLIVTGESSPLARARTYATRTPGCHVLAKPFNARALLEAVDQLLLDTEGDSK